jgi:serine/threonine protein kinase
MPVQLEAATERARARIGTVLKQKWRLDKLIGVGGMAAVYAATHRNQKRAAIKMLHPELSMDAAIRERFLREGYVANAIGQQGAVTVDYDDVSEDGLAYLVMELLDGETIEQRWVRKGRLLSPEEALSVVDQLLDTLAAAHARGIVHRDLKPENLFLTRDGSVKILDFGIARVRELSSPLTKTQAGSTMGTPAFMAPEQARGRWEDVDGRSDLWAVGATIYTLLTGQFVHQAETVHETLALAVTRPARSLGERRGDLHRALIRFVDKALAYDKAARFADAASMQHALRLTYAQMQGHEGSIRAHLQMAKFDGQPSQTITLLNLTPGRPLVASGQPTVVRVASRRWRWLALGGALALVAGFGWFQSTRHAQITISPTRVLAAPLTTLTRARPQPAASNGVAEPLPHGVLLADLPLEAPNSGSARAARKRSAGAPATHALR